MDRSEVMELIESPYRNGLSKFHQYQSASNDCGPFAAAMAINFLKGRRINGAELGQKMNKIAWRNGFPTVSRISNWATFPWGVAAQLRENGILAKWRILQSIDYLLDNLVSRYIFIVIIGELRPMWAHYKLLVAYDDQLGWGFIDPSRRNGLTYWDTQTFFKRRWNNYGRQLVQVDFGGYQP